MTSTTSITNYWLSSNLKCILLGDVQLFIPAFTKLGCAASRLLLSITSECWGCILAQFIAYSIFGANMRHSIIALEVRWLTQWPVEGWRAETHEFQQIYFNQIYFNVMSSYRNDKLAGAKMYYWVLNLFLNIGRKPTLESFDCVLRGHTLDTRGSGSCIEPEEIFYLRWCHNVVSWTLYQAPTGSSDFFRLCELINLSVQKWFDYEKP